MPNVIFYIYVIKHMSNVRYIIHTSHVIMPSEIYYIYNIYLIMPVIYYIYVIKICM